MQTIALAGHKRGAGKTTLAVELAACAKNALILDLDPQQAATAWAERRGLNWPVVHPIDAEVLNEALAWARDKGFRWVFVDTSSQAKPEVIRNAIDAADRVMIPSRSGAADLGVLAETVRMIPPGSAATIVLNACIPFGGGIRSHLQRQAFTEAGRYGLPVSPCVVAERSAFPKAFEEGRTALEDEPESKAAADVVALWTWLSHGSTVLAA